MKKINTSVYPNVDPRNHKSNRALLEKIGVDGRVPLRQARINAGLDVPELKAAA